MTENERRKIRQLVDESLAAARLREAEQREELPAPEKDIRAQRLSLRRTG
jgi:hypothetical protein